MKRFTRTKEDFTCLHCKAEVKGNGYTNHCPACLWSRHVDTRPGDRQNMCMGEMCPLRIEMEHGEFILIHGCVKCGIEKQIKTQPEDNLNVLLRTKMED